MAIQINGNGTITGISSGGLPAGSVTSATLADGAASGTKLSMPAGTIIQTKFYRTTTQTTVNTSNTATPVLTGTITPSSASNKILITYHGQFSYYNNRNHCHVQIMKSGSVLAGTFGAGTDGSTIYYNGNKILYIAGSSDNNRLVASGSYEDTAGSTSSITYGIGISVNSNDGGSDYADCNRSRGSTGYGSSTELVLQEIKV